MSLKGFEPPTHGLEGRCSIQLSYRLMKAGDGNRTHVISLEGWSSTIELHPHILFAVLCFPQRQVILYHHFL